MTSATDGYAGGVSFIRDTRGVSGGQRGNVNTSLYSYTIAGKDVKAFEWNALFVLDNFADEGENCGFYAQGNKHGRGPTWGGCIEVCDTTDDDVTAVVGLECDVWVSGKDDGKRYGIDIVLGDSHTKRNLPASTEVGGTAALRIGGEGTWSTGIDFTSARVKKAIHLNPNQGIYVGSVNILWVLYLSLFFSACAVIK